MTRMRAGRALKLGSGLAALAGLALLAVLVVYQDVAAVGRILFSAGWGIAAITAFYLIPLMVSAQAWRIVTSPVWRGSALVFFWARLVREAVNSLLPVAQIGGNLVGARILTFHGARGSLAGAAVIVDLTVELYTEVVFAALGAGLLLLRGAGAASRPIVIGLGVAVFAVGGFLLAQRWGMFRLIERQLERIAVRFGWTALGSLANLHETMMAIYRDRRAIAAATAWHLAAWALGAVEVWLILFFLNVEASFAEAFVIESLGQAIRSMAFLVPGAFGVQEGGYMLLGVFFGLEPDIALSVSLIKRIRDLALGVPAMLSWQLIEGRRLVDALDDGKPNGA